MKLKLSFLAVIASLVVTVATVAPAASAAPPQAGFPTVTLTEIVGSPCTGVDQTLGAFTGTITSATATITGFSAAGGVVYATGTVTAVCRNVLTGATQTATQPFTVPLLPTTGGTCQILHLELGPIHLTLLGLNVDTNRIVLDITATTGPGNLLGNLLCGLANALNNGASANTIANLLNRLLMILG